MTRPALRTRMVVACVLQALLVAFAVWPQLSARLTGEEYLLEVAPLDPIDPFRGAYVTLDYPGLPDGEERPLPTGDVFVPLREDGADGVWRGTEVLEQAPADGPYLRCSSGGFRLECGIESLFASQEQARRLEGELVDGARARVRVDGRGHAAVLELVPAPQDR